jgi:Na+-driven multidrug efflux pump
MAISTALFVALTWLLMPWMGNNGLFLSLMLFMGIRAVALWIRYPAILPVAHNTENTGDSILNR